MTGKVDNKAVDDEATATQETPGYTDVDAATEGIEQKGPTTTAHKRTEETFPKEAVEKEAGFIIQTAYQTDLGKYVDDHGFAILFDMPQSDPGHKVNCKFVAPYHIIYISLIIILISEETKRERTRKRDEFLRIEEDFLSSIGKKTCVIDPIADIFPKKDFIENRVCVDTIINAHTLSHPENLGMCVQREALTNLNPTMRDCFLDITESKHRRCVDEGCNTILNIMEYTQADTYVATSMHGDHSLARQMYRKPSTNQASPNLALLTSGTEFTLDQLVCYRVVDDEKMAPIGVIYKINNRTTAVHFSAGKVIPVGEGKYAYYLNDSMGILTNKGDEADTQRPWVRLTSEMANRPYSDPTMPPLSKLEIAFVLYMKISVFEVMAVLLDPSDHEKMKTAHILTHQKNGCPVEVVALLLSQLDWRLVIFKSGIQSHVGPYLGAMPSTLHSCHDFPMVEAQNILLVLADEWRELDGALERLFQLMENHVLVYNKGQLVKYSRERVEGPDVILDNLFLLASGYAVGLDANGELVEYRSFCGTIENNWYAKIDTESQISNVIFTQFVLVTSRVLELVFCEPCNSDDNTLENELANTMELGRQRADAILTTMYIYTNDSTKERSDEIEEIERKCIQVIAANVNHGSSFHWLAAVFFSFLGFKLVIVDNGGPGLENSFEDCKYVPSSAEEEIGVEHYKSLLRRTALLLTIDPTCKLIIARVVKLRWRIH